MCFQKQWGLPDRGWNLALRRLDERGADALGEVREVRHAVLLGVVLLGVIVAVVDQELAPENCWRVGVRAGSLLFITVHHCLLLFMFVILSYFLLLFTIVYHWSLSSFIISMRIMVCHSLSFSMFIIYIVVHITYYQWSRVEGGRAYWHSAALYSRRIRRSGTRARRLLACRGQGGGCLSLFTFIILLFIIVCSIIYIWLLFMCIIYSICHYLLLFMYRMYITSCIMYDLGSRVQVL